MENKDQKDAWTTWVSRTSDILSVAKGMASFAAILAVAFIIIWTPSRVVPTLKGLLVALRDSGFTRISVTGMEADLTKLTEAVSTANQGASSALRSLNAAKASLEKIYSSETLSSMNKSDVKEALNSVNTALRSLSLSRTDSTGILAQAGISTSAPDNTKESIQWLVVVGADATAQEAEFERSKVKRKGFGNSTILLRNNLYRTVVPFNDRETAEASITKIGAAVKRQVFAVDAKQWCPQAAKALTPGNAATLVTCTTD